MNTGDVNLEADYCGIEAAHYLDYPGLLCDKNVASVTRKLVCNANLGPLPVDIRTSVCDAEENMVAAFDQGRCSSNIDNGKKVASSSYSKENGRMEFRLPVNPNNGCAEFW